MNLNNMQLYLPFFEYIHSIIKKTMYLDFFFNPM